MRHQACFLIQVDYAGIEIVVDRLQRGRNVVFERRRRLSANDEKRQYQQAANQVAMH